MSAAIVWALQNGESFGEALRWGVAAGTAAAKLPGITLANSCSGKGSLPAYAADAHHRLVVLFVDNLLAPEPFRF